MKTFDAVYLLKAFTASIIGLFLFVVLSSLLPQNQVQRNIEKSVQDVLPFGDYPEPMIHGRKHSLDYSMDAFTVNMIYTIDPKSPLQSALLLNSRHSNGPYVSQWNQVKYNIEHKELTPNLQYPRYWHGSTFFFRWFFLFGTYNDIKWLLYIASSLLMLLAGVRMAQDTSLATAVVYLGSLFLVNSYIAQFSIQFAPVLIITLISSIALTRTSPGDLRKTALIFLLSAVFTAFFDLLTTPLLTFGMPMMLWIQRQKNLREMTFMQSLKQPVMLGFVWLLGFSFTWISKWILTATFTDFPIFTNVIDEFFKLSAAQEGNGLSAIVLNVNQLPLVIINSILFVMALLALFFRKRPDWNKITLTLLTSLLPFIWYVTLSHHSNVHYWFTYRMLAFTVAGLFWVFLNLISEVKVHDAIAKVMKRK